MRGYRFWIRLSFLFVFLVVVAGGVVRMTGSGMGCPDWPKCFGMWVPPTDVSQLPENYQEIYAHRGYKDTSFNVFHTWTEYINRLVGALAGIVVFITFLISIPQFKKHMEITIGSGVLVLLMGFQAWLGAVVVYSVLQPVKITIHMLAALLILSLILWLWNRAKGFDLIPSSKGLKKSMLAMLVLLLVQVGLGTQVRQWVDEMKNTLPNFSSQWDSHLTWAFYVHRSFSLLLLGFGFWMLWQARKWPIFRPYVLRFQIILVASAVIGVVLAHFDIPAWAQPLHLVLASALWSYGYWLYLRVSAIAPTR